MGRARSSDWCSNGPMAAWTHTAVARSGPTRSRSGLRLTRLKELRHDNVSNVEEHQTLATEWQSKSELVQPNRAEASVLTLENATVTDRVSLKPTSAREIFAERFDFGACGA